MISGAPGPLSPALLERTSPRSHWLVLAAILLLALGVRCWHLGHESFWLDEVFSVESAMGRGFAHRLLPTNKLIDNPPAYTDPAGAAPWWKIWPACRGPAGDIHPPLAYIALRGWCSLFGYSDAAARSLSVAASIAAIGLLFFIGRRLHGSTVALWGCALMAVASPQIQYAQEAKHYALLQALSLGVCLILLSIETNGSKLPRLLALNFASLVMLLTHYFSIAPLGALALYAVLRLRGPDRSRVLAAFIVAGFAFLVVWGPSLLHQLHDAGSEADYFRDADPGYLLRELHRLVVLPYRFLNEPLPSAEVATYFTGIVCLLPIVLVRRRADLLLWAIWIPCILLFVVLVDLLRHSWLLDLIRYTLLAGPGIYMVLAALGSHLRPRWRYVLPALCLASCLISIPSVYDVQKSDVRGLAHALLTRAKPGDVTVFCSAVRTRQNAFHYFIATSHYARPMPGGVVLLERPADGPLLDELRARGHVWVIGDSEDIQEFLPGAEIHMARLFPNAGCLLTATWPAPKDPSPQRAH